MYDVLCCFAHCVKKNGILRAGFICIASCLKCEIMALFEIDKSQISFSASETALFFCLFVCLFFFCSLFFFFLFPLFSVKLNSSILRNYMPTMMPSG